MTKEQKDKILNALVACDEAPGQNITAWKVHDGFYVKVMDMDIYFN